MLFFLKASSSVGTPCLTALGVIFFLKELLKVAYVVVPIGLILMLSLDFAKGVIDFGDSSGKVLNFVLRRVVYTLFVFLIPTISFGLLNAIGAINNDSKSCWSYVDEVSVKEVKYILETQQSKLSDEIDKYRAEIAQNLGFKAKSEGLRRIIANNSDGTSSSGATVAVGQKYDLSYQELKEITALCVQEQGSAVGAAAEASLMANRFEFYPRKCHGCSSLHGYVKNTGWWAKASEHMSKTGKANDKAIAAVKDVLVNGNRTVPLYIDEHDCFSDISKVVTGGSTYTSSGDISKKSHYKKDTTVVYNNNGAVYTFYSFPSSDPFGYTKTAMDKYKKLNN